VSSVIPRARIYNLQVDYLKYLPSTTNSQFEYLNQFVIDSQFLGPEDEAYSPYNTDIPIAEP
jgi:hypothetical protein